MGRSFKELISLIKNGDFIEASVLNTVFRELDANAKYLKELIASSLMGETVFARDVTVESAANVGMAVYYDSATAQWKRSQAAADIVDGNVVAASQAQAWGVVHSKANSTRANLLLLGFAEISLAAAVDGEVTPGQYFLSGTSPGKLTKVSPPVGIPVLQVAGPGAAAGTWKVFVKTSFTDFFHGHQHYSQYLLAAPAGTGVLTGETWSIDSPDADAEGWLPADHAVFADSAPAGAVFGYNLKASSLGDIWPPMPVGSALVQWFRGSGLDSGFTTVPDSLVVLDNQGIWWMSSCENEVPWPADINDVVTTTTSEPQCPVPQPMQMKIYFTQMAFQTDNAVVSRLQIAPGSEDLLELKCPDTGLPATTGNLQLGLNLQFLTSNTPDLGSQAFKSLNGQQFTRGPVVCRVKPASDNVVITGSQSGEYYYGDVSISVVDSSLVGNGGLLWVDTVRLDGVEEENYDDILALMFPPNKTTAFRGRIFIPPLVGVTQLSLVWRGWWLGRTSGAFPELQLTYRTISRPDPPGTPIAVPSADDELPVGIDGTSVIFSAPNRYFELDSSPMIAKPGDIILFTLERPGVGGDAYAGELHLIRQAAVITGTS